MKIEIYTKNLDLTDELKKFAIEKVSHLEKFLPRGKEIDVAVELSKTTKHHRKGNVLYAEIQINMHGKKIRAVSAREDLETALLEARDEAEREIKKYKEKTGDVRKKGGRFLKKLFSLSPLARFKKKEKEL